MATFDALAPQLEFALLLLAFVGTTAAEGLTALWAAGSRRHWFWRALAVWAAVILLVVLHIPLVTLVFSLLGPLIFAVVAMFRWYVWPGAWAEEGGNRHVCPGAAWQAFKVVVLVLGALVGVAVAGELWPFSKGLVLLWPAIFELVIWIRWRHDPPPRATVHLRDLLLAMVAVGLLLVWFRAARDQFVVGGDWGLYHHCHGPGGYDCDGLVYGFWPLQALGSAAFFGIGCGGRMGIARGRLLADGLVCSL